MQSTLLSLTTFLLVLLCLTKPLGLWIEPLARGRAPAFLSSIDTKIMKVFGVQDQGQSWLTYAISLVLFNVAGVLFLYAILRLQHLLPLNPMGFEAMSASQAFNTAISFVTNTNWQSYGGETTVSYLSQMAGLGVQNFLSAATGICVAFALMRGISQENSTVIGNFWADVIRVTLWLLLPLSIVFALFLVSQGVIQNFSEYLTVKTLAGDSQTLAMGPVASQEAIKLLGTNGGGFFNANSAHPFENPTQLSNFFESLSILAIPAALVYVFGRMVNNIRQGWTLWAVMAVFLSAAMIAFAWFESHPSDWMQTINATGQMPMEGKETRFDLAATSLFSVVTTAASCGAVNTMHDSLTPLAGLIPMWLMQIGEVIFGGVGSGFYGMIVYVLTGVFISGLMIGRSPEYIGKKITPQHMKFVCIALLTTPVIVLAGTAITVMIPSALESLNNSGAHGFSEILYAWSSAANNNGSAFAGLNANTDFFNLGLGCAMWLGRFVVIVAILALAGTLATGRRCAVSAATLPTDGPLFACVLLGVIVLIGALTFLPALTLGPIAEHLSVLTIQ